MKFIRTSLLVSGAALVAAVPMRLILVEHIGPIPAPRIGLAGAEAFHDPAAIDFKAAQEPDTEPNMVSEIFVPIPNDQEDPFAPDFIQERPKHHHCGKKKNIVMAKMDDFSRFLRKLFGFDPIEEFDLSIPHRIAEHHHDEEHPDPEMMVAPAESDEDNSKFHILPFMPGPVHIEGFPGSDDASSSHPHPPPPPEFPGRHRMWRHRPQSFIGRLHKAFLTLSPWEGRALSFVVGCGIGVLLRMLYVFSVLAYRCFFAQPRLRLEDRQEEEEHAPAAGATVERQALAPPPEYNEKGGSQ